VLLSHAVNLPGKVPNKKFVRPAVGFKHVPLTVTAVPPVIGPLKGKMPVTVGEMESRFDLGPKNPVLEGPSAVSTVTT
jgi:hypothetical protein